MSSASDYMSILDAIASSKYIDYSGRGYNTDTGYSRYAGNADYSYGQSFSPTGGRVNQNVARDVQRTLTSGGLKAIGKIGTGTLAASMAGVPTSSAFSLGLSMGLGPSSMAGLMGNVAASAMGVKPSGWATSIAGTLGTLIGGPIGGLLGASIGSIGWDAIKDALDMRDEEVARDYTEEGLGYIAGRQTYQGLQNTLSDMGYGDKRNPVSTVARNAALHTALTNQYGLDDGQAKYNTAMQFSGPMTMDTALGPVTTNMGMPSYGLSMMSMSGFDNAPDAGVPDSPFGSGFTSAQDAVTDALSGMGFGGYADSISQAADSLSSFGTNDLTDSIGGNWGGVQGMSPDTAASYGEAMSGTPDSEDTDTTNDTDTSDTDTTSDTDSTSSSDTGSSSTGSDSDSSGTDSDSSGSDGSSSSDFGGSDMGGANDNGDSTPGNDGDSDSDSDNDGGSDW